MVVQTGRFGQIEVSTDEIISIPSGILGFPDDQNFCLVDPGDETLILWLQSLSNPRLAFPVLEPRIFKSNYIVRLSAAELRELRLSSIQEASVFTILTIPNQLPEMTANLKAPLVINVRDRVAKQVVLQENDQPIKHPMFKELRAQILSVRSASSEVVKSNDRSVVSVGTLPLTTRVELI
ncbi:MAG: flagellar assembly protein FliW [Bdellovibrionales bacterium]|nr:flagellar assembly protein FliW [Bdellovibrionales bacterium]